MGFFHSGEPEPPRTGSKILPKQRRGQRHRQRLERQLQQQQSRPATKLKVPRVKLIRRRPQLVYAHPGPDDPVHARRRHTIISLLNEIEVYDGTFYFNMKYAIHALMRTDQRLADEFAGAYANLLEAEREYDEEYDDYADEEEDEPGDVA